MSYLTRLTLVFSLLAAIVPATLAAEKDQLRTALKDTVVQGPWIYDDVEAGFAEAKKTGKPLLVVVRCVPCIGYRQIDKLVAERDPMVAKLLDQFVTVRVVQAYGLDLSLFECDSDMNWAVFFLNADRTIYGRYSTRTSRDPSNDVSLEGFAQALEGALELHGAYPKNKAALAAKSPRPPRWATPEKMPSIPGKVVPADGTRANCLHCHDIQPGRILSARKAGQPVEDRDIWAYPNPATLGLVFDVKEKATLQSVTTDSAAARAGFQKGDQVLKLAGQPLLSIADVQWVLHEAAEGAKLEAEVKRGSETKKLTLPLAEGWRRAGDVTWRPMMWPLRNWLAGFKPGVANAKQRTDAGVAADAPALRVEQITPDFVKERNPSPAKAGLKQGDLVIAVDGQTEALTNETWLLAHLARKKSGEAVKLTVMRGGQRKEIEMTLP